MEIREIVNELEFYFKNFQKFEEKLQPKTLTKRLEELNEKMIAPNFWSDHEEVQKVISEEKLIKSKLNNFKKLKSQLEEIETLVEMYNEEEDSSLLKEMQGLIEIVGEELEKFEVSLLLTGEFDTNNAIVELHTGAGGADAADFCDMLYRMYTRHFEKKGYKMKVLHYVPNDEAGIKNVIIKVEGENSYGFLKGENGVHRLVRISPFNSQGKRQTSFASVVVTPEIDDNINIDIKEEDLKIDTFRAGGAGGQSVNTTDSAVRITHKPTNTVVSCQNERSQIQNKEVALKILKSKLYQIEVVKKQERIDKMRSGSKEIAFGNHMRSYVMHPYSLVKDHRTNQEANDVNKVLDGEIDIFINAYLHEFS